MLGDFDIVTLGQPSSRDADLRRRYGITLAQYDALLVAQGGVCAICRRPETLKRRGRLVPLIWWITTMARRPSGGCSATAATSPSHGSKERVDEADAVLSRALAYVRGELP